MKKLKVMLALGVTLCMLSGQSVLAAELPATAPEVTESTDDVNVPELTEEAGTQEEADTEDSAEQAQAPDAQEGTDAVEQAAGSAEENNQDKQQAESRYIAVDMESISISTPLVSAKEKFVFSFKLQDNKYTFDGEGSQVVFKLNNVNDTTTFPVSISYDSKSGTYTGTGSIDGWGAPDQEIDMSVSSILLNAADGDKYEIVNGTPQQYDHDKHTQDLSKFSFTFVNTAYPFIDIPAGAWYQGTVDIVNYLGLMTGTKPDTFAPVSILSRAQFATLIYRMEDCPEVEYDTTFTDVPKDQFYTEAVIWANEAGIITGYNSKTFGPADMLTREQMATMMYRYAKYKKFDVSGQADLTGFPDHQNVSGFAKEAMNWANYKSIITGDGGKLNPQGNVSRAVCATIVSRFIAAYL